MNQFDSADEFVKHWHDRVAGMALRGLVLDADTKPMGPYSAGQVALSLPERTEKLLRQMFIDARKLVMAEIEESKPLPTKAAPPTQGK